MTKSLNNFFKTLNDKVYIVNPEDAEDWADQSQTMWLWVRIDSRLTNTGYVFTYAPITPEGYDARYAFEDGFGEMIEFND